MVVLATVLLQAGWVTPPTPPNARRGWPLYERLCLACHGARGDGRGPAAAYVWPAPRDLTRGDFKWQSTPAGAAARDDDLRATIMHGAPGTAMPAFPALDAAAIDDVIDVIRAFAPGDRPAASSIELGPPPPPAPARGAAIWRARGCATCHGEAGDGRATSAALREPAYDLTVGLRRPRGPGGDAYRAAAAMSIAAGLAGTAMPSYAGTIDRGEIWALADHVVAIGPAHDPPTGRANLPALPAAAIALDRQAPIETATWPGARDDADAAVFGAAVAAQGEPPAALAPAQASLHAQQCARCHIQQFRAWSTSVHRGAASPGVLAQTEFGMAAGDRAGCLRCHAPLAEQAISANPDLRAESVSCAGCHVRNWVRHGPPNVAPSLLPITGYPLIISSLYERADFCLPCHQLPPRTAVAGKPLLDTYREWLTGPYAPRGVQCQHCHMASRDHSVLGIHDPATVRQAIALTARATRLAGHVTATAALTNVGAGHAFPTTATPAVWLSIRLLDARGQPIAGASDRRRIGRDVAFDGAWHERADSRIAPGATFAVARDWVGGRVGDAVTARIVVEVQPDAYYERIYAQALARKLAPAQRALYEQAAARAAGSHYIVEQRDVAIP
ncbi:MAG TPA: c-type cytochrome [Kofleriaceae bacterium]|nr:c-type cytochrome [Kofleriaceae bacterium]